MLNILLWTIALFLTGCFLRWANSKPRQRVYIVPVVWNEHRRRAVDRSVKKLKVVGPI